MTAAFLPTKQELACLIEYLAGQAKKSGVKVELNREVTPKLIDEFRPDAIIIATGGLPLIPPNIPGVNRKNVVTSWDVLTGRTMPGQKIWSSGEAPRGVRPLIFPLILSMI